MTGRWARTTLCDDLGGVPVFYEVSNEHLYRYADVGLTFVKLGEEARVDLTTFTVEGSRGKRFRAALHRLERERASFRVIPQEHVSCVMDQLRSVSEDWLTQHAGAEKGFSLGFFAPEYVSRFPVAVIERDGRIVAFANIWQGAQHIELSVDLMRYDQRAPKDVMDALFVHIMLWANVRVHPCRRSTRAGRCGVRQFHDRKPGSDHGRGARRLGHLRGDVGRDAPSDWD